MENNYDFVIKVSIFRRDRIIHYREWGGTSLRYEEVVKTKKKPKRKKEILEGVKYR